MSRPRTPVFLATVAGAAVVLALGVLVVAQPTRTPRSDLFPDKLADMTLTVYVDGAAAIAEVQALHRNNPGVQMTNAYLVRYSGTGTRARFWVSESAGDAEAASLLGAMRSTVGDSGVFSQPQPLSLEGLTACFVTGLPEIGTYNYFYAQGRRVFWVQIDNPDQARRMDVLGESMRRIGR